MNRRRKPGITRIGRKNQLTIPADVMTDADLRCGDTLRVSSDGPGRVVLTRENDVVNRYAGALTGTYEPGELDRMRDEWVDHERRE